MDDDRDSAQVCGVAGDRLHQGQERDSSWRGYGERKRNFVGQHFWARGFVSTVAPVMRGRVSDPDHQLRAAHNRMPLPEDCYASFMIALPVVYFHRGLRKNFRGYDCKRLSASVLRA